MKKFLKSIVGLLCAAAIFLPVFAGCDFNFGGSGGSGTGGGSGTQKEIDYVGNLKLNMNSATLKQVVTVQSLIDGDTTHFKPADGNTSKFPIGNGIIKARYLAVNTPESTGKIEKWGKTAALYTNEKLGNAAKILIESDDANANVDSTGERYLLWIWYIPAGKDANDTSNYRNLNIELLQNGYGRSSKTSENRYGTQASAALAQAQDLGLKIYSNDEDPNYFGSNAEYMTLKYLRFHVKEYVDHPVCVTGVVTAKFGNTAYIEAYDNDEEGVSQLPGHENDGSTGISYGMAVYYGFNTGAILDILEVGNMVKVVGTLTEFFGTYQISNVNYNPVRPQEQTNTIRLTEENHGEIPLPERRQTTVTPADLQLGTGARTVTATFITDAEEGTTEQLTIEYGAAIQNTFVKLENLTVTDRYTTSKDSSASKGAMSITVKGAGSDLTVTLRTEVLKKADGSLYTQDDIPDKIYSVQGLVDYYSYNDQPPQYQIAVYKFEHFEFTAP